MWGLFWRRQDAAGGAGGVFGASNGVTPACSEGIVMPAHRLPTAMHIAKGSYKKDPQRAKARESEPNVGDPIGSYPASFLPDGEFDSTEKKRLRALWDELLADAAPGVLNRSHRWHVECACRAMLTVRSGSRKAADLNNVDKFLTKMGMNPAAQSTVSGGAFAPAGGASSIGKLAARAQSQRTG